VSNQHRPERYVRRGVAGDDDELDVRCRHCKDDWPCTASEEEVNDDGEPQ
jgi:hypothetical protein